MSGVVYLSIVVVARNDNYGGDFNFRFQRFLDLNLPLLSQLPYSIEIVIVNWNFIENSISLEDMFVWPNSFKNIICRIILVPNSIHNLYNDLKIRKELSVYEFIAKNAGIRRAKGDFILTTNADIVFSKHIIDSLINLKPDRYYRANRFDYNYDNLVTESEKEILRAVFRIWLKGFDYKVNGVNCFKYAVFQYYNRVKVKWELTKIRNVWIPPIFNLNHDYAEYMFHSNNCGDFILTHKSNFFLLNGFPENTYVSTHTDALFVCMLFTLTGREVVFDAPIFHQDHERRFNWADIKNDPVLLKAYRFFEENALYMLNSKNVIIFNDEKWGLGDIDLEEIERK